MYRISIDFSIFTKSGNSSRVYGEIDVSVIPQVGDRISFPLLSKPGIDLDTCAPYICKHRIVTDRVITVNADISEVIILLDDVMVLSDDQATSVMEYFEKAYSLVGDVHNT